MCSRRMLIALVAGACAAGSVALAAPQITIVVCAPGYPGSTEEAQPAMDDLAGGVARAAGWSSERVAAVYHPTAEGGLEALLSEGTGLALVPLPFYLEHRERLALEPFLAVTEIAAPEAVWSLVAKRGAVEGPATLSGWEVAGMPGYSPRFVRRVALAEWGELPEDVRIEFSSRVLSVLRRAAGGEPVAALLDRAQAEALGALPFGDDLEVVARSRPMPGSLLCRVDGRLSDPEHERLKAAFLGLDGSEGGRALLDALRIVRFESSSAEELSRVERAFAAGGAAPR